MEIFKPKALREFKRSTTMSAVRLIFVAKWIFNSNFFLEANWFAEKQAPIKSTKTCPPIQVKLKRWERIKCKPNSLPIVHKMHVKLGDTVKVIAGRDKGKIGEIIKIVKHNSTVIVKEINLKTKHLKSKEEGESGQIVKIEAAIHSSNVMLYSKEQNVASRVGHKTLENGKRVRYLLKTGEVIDSEEVWKKVIKERERKKEEITVAS